MYVAVLVVCLSAQSCEFYYADKQPEIWPTEAECTQFATGMRNMAVRLWPDAHVITWGCLALGQGGKVPGDPSTE